LISNDVYIDKDMRFITEAEHVHTSSDQLYSQFEQLTMRLGMESEEDEDEDSQSC